MRLIHLSEVFDEIIEKRLEFNQLELEDKEVQQEKLKNARKEEKGKLRRAYDLFGIDITKLSVKNRYYINEDYKESIVWILLYTGVYKNKNKEIEAKRDISIHTMESFMNGKFKNIETVFLKFIVAHMVNGLLAFNTEELSEQQRQYLERGIQCIYSSTRLYHRQVDETISNLFDETIFRLEDKRIIYHYLKDMLNSIGDIAQQLVNEIQEYREVEQGEHVFSQVSEVNKYGQQIRQEEIKLLNEIVYDSSIEVLKDILDRMEQEKARAHNGMEEITIGQDVRAWLEGVSEKQKVKGEVKKCNDRERTKLEYGLIGIEEEIKFLKKEKKRIHYTSKGKKEIEEKIEQFQQLKVNIANRIGELAEKDRHI